MIRGQWSVKNRVDLLPAAYCLPLSAYSPDELWRFLPLGYLLTILIETPILCVGLSRRHPLSRKLLAGIWLTACTYPIVTLVLPLLFAPERRGLYLLVAETFAPVAECALLVGIRYEQRVGKGFNVARLRGHHHCEPCFFRDW